MDYKNKEGLVEMEFLWNVSSIYKDDDECLDATVHKEFMGEKGESWQDLLSRAAKENTELDYSEVIDNSAKSDLVEITRYLSYIHCIVDGDDEWEMMTEGEEVYDFYIEAEKKVT
tara:strand:- start:1311 stop:1655 length:345 start_codon:yes stop_codon:yes gene_type:complete